MNEDLWEIVDAINGCRFQHVSDAAVLASLYDDNSTLDEIKEQLGISMTQLRDAMRRLGMREREPEVMHA